MRPTASRGAPQQRRMAHVERERCQDQAGCRGAAVSGVREPRHGRTDAPHLRVWRGRRLERARRVRVPGLPRRMAGGVVSAPAEVGALLDEAAEIREELRAWGDDAPDDAVRALLERRDAVEARLAELGWGDR